MTNLSSNRNSDDDIILNPAQQYAIEFVNYLHTETGFTKEAFTIAGLENYLKKIGKNCFQLQIYGDLLKSLFNIVLIFSRSINDKIEKAAEIFVMLLHKITTFLIKYYLTGGLLILINGEMSRCMVAFLIVLCHVVIFIYKNVSYTCFVKLKEWIIMLFNSENVRCFFEDVFPNYGRALTVA